MKLTVSAGGPTMSVVSGGRSPTGSVDIARANGENETTVPQTSPFAGSPDELTSCQPPPV